MEKTTVEPTTSADGGAAAHGVDADPERRPGVPMEAEPRPAEGAHWIEPERQPGADEHPHRAELDRATPVVGTAQPYRGVSGLLRRGAYSIPEHYARHWLLLMAADRVDVLEGRLGAALSPPLRDAGLTRLSRRVERNPVGAIAVAVGAAWLLKRVVT